MTDTDVIRIAQASSNAAVYLHGSGWQLQGLSDNDSLWTKEADGQYWEALLPLSSERSDRFRRFNELLTVLENVEGRNVASVVEDIERARSDLIRIRTVPEARPGSAPIEDALQSVAAARDLMLAAAASLDAPRAVYGSRKPDSAVRFVRSVQLSTEPGSFVIALEAPVSPDLTTMEISAIPGAAEIEDQALFPDVRVPFARRATERLMEAVGRALMICAQVVDGTADIESFDEGVPVGISANLLEALTRLGGRDLGAQNGLREVGIAARWSYNRRPPQAGSAYIARREWIPVMALAAESLRARQPEPEVTLMGQVVALRRDDDLQTDTVTLRAYIDESGRGRIRNVRLVLDSPEQRKLVVDAYHTRESVRVSGDLQPGLQVTMTNITRVEYASVQEGGYLPPAAAVEIHTIAPGENTGPGESAAEASP